MSGRAAKKLRLFKKQHPVQGAWISRFSKSFQRKIARALQYGRDVQRPGGG